MLSRPKRVQLSVGEESSTFETSTVLGPNTKGTKRSDPESDRTNFGMTAGTSCGPFTFPVFFTNSETFCFNVRA
jgi:hypothetical protein